jgi:hypothetical protein
LVKKNRSKKSPATTSNPLLATDNPFAGVNKSNPAFTNTASIEEGFGFPENATVAAPEANNAQLAAEGFGFLENSPVAPPAANNAKLAAEGFGFHENSPVAPPAANNAKLAAEGFGFLGNSTVAPPAANTARIAKEEEEFGFPKNSTDNRGNFIFPRVDENEPITIVSDTEGFNPSTQIEKIMAAKKLIYLGDFLDYTTNYNTNKVEPYKVSRENLCSLKLLQHFNNNPNVKSVLGNREFNKVKFWPLLQIIQKGSEKKIINWWDNGNTIFDIALKLCTQYKPSSEGSEYKWVIENLQSFCPYWRYNKSINKNAQFKKKFEERWGYKRLK